MSSRVKFIILGLLAVAGLNFANLLQNPAFDSWRDDSTPGNWVVEWRDSCGVFKELGTIHSGPFSAQLVRRKSGTGFNKGLRQRIPITPGVSYTLTAWFYDNHDQVSGGIVLTWRRADSSFISSTSTVYTEDTADWQRLTNTGIAPSAQDSVAAFVDVLLRTYGFTGSQPGGFVFVDDANFDVSGISETNNTLPTMVNFVILPNPASFNHQIKFQLDKTNSVRINIYDNSGKLIKKVINQTLHPGLYNINWNGKDEKFASVPNGIYYGVLYKKGSQPFIKKFVHTSK